MGPFSTKLGIKHPWVKKLIVLQKGLLNSQKGDKQVFSSPNKSYDIHM